MAKEHYAVVYSLGKTMLNSVLKRVTGNLGYTEGQQDKLAGNLQLSHWLCVLS